MLSLFADHNIPVPLVRTVNAYLEATGKGRFVTLRDEFSEDISDIAYINALSSDTIKWVVITADKAILKNKAEQAAFRGANLPIFICTKSFNSLPILEKIINFLRKIEHLEKEIAKHRGGFIARLDKSLSKFEII